MYSELENIRFKLDQAINSSEVNSKIICKNVNNINKTIDKKYLKNEASANFKLIYEKHFDENKKASIINKIKLDLIKLYKNITTLELEILSNNIYDFCILMIYKVSPEEIGKYIIYRNNYYCNLLTNEDKRIHFNNERLECFTKLTNKYINIISGKQNN